ncbi:MAG: hypothetical protein WBV94_25105 [Blastocatellia bacterium]
MRAYSRNILRAIAACILLTINLHAQSPWRPLIGGEREAKDQTSAGGIRFNARKMNRRAAEKREKIMRKTINYLFEQGAAHLLDDYTEMAGRVISEPDGFGDEFDEGEAEMAKLWQECGESYARTYDRSRAPRVIIRDRPFWDHSHRIWVNGRYNATTDRTIEIVGLASSFLLSKPSEAYFISAKELYKWERGNMLQCEHFGHCAVDIAHELGDRSPCAVR